MTERRQSHRQWWRVAPGLGATLVAACFQATLEAPPPDAETAPEPEASAGSDASTAPSAARHPDCAASSEQGPPSSGPPFERGPFWDADSLNQFLEEECDTVASLPSCDLDTPCAFGKCLQLIPRASGVCVDDARCETPLAFQDGRCGACVRHRERAAICCHHRQGVDCRRWPLSHASSVGGLCSEDGECEEGLWCAAGRGQPWLGTCACPGASLDASSSFQGCGTPDTPREREPELPVFTQDNPAYAWIVGDGIAAEVADFVRFFLEKTEEKVRFELSHVLAPQLALCDLLPARESILPEERRLRPSLESTTHATDLIVLQFWGYATSPCMAGLAPGSEAYYERVLRDATEAIAEIEAAARAQDRRRPRLLWVLQGPDADQPARVRRLNQVYALLASEHGDRTSDAGREVSKLADYYLPPDPENRYVWVEFLPCTDLERRGELTECTVPDRYGGVTQLHKTGEKVLFCLADPDTGAPCNLLKSPGAKRYMSVIYEDARRWLDL